jgi:uncharacterized protein (DUF58 family)
MPTRRLLLAGLMLVFASSIAVLEDGVLRFVLGADVLLLALFALDFWFSRRTALFAERSGPGVLVQGVNASFEVSLKSDRDLDLRLRETLHAGVAGSPLRGDVRTEDGMGVWRYTVKPRSRGTHSLGPLVVRIPGPLGLAMSQRELLSGEQIRVFPQVRWDGTVGHILNLAHRKQLGQNPLKDRGIGYEPYALREYRAGDPRTKIHWKASARRGHLISREDSWDRGARLAILLDCGRPMASTDGDRGKLDWALAATMALVRVAAGRGDHVTVIAFADRILRTVRVRPGSRGAAAAYAALFDLEAELSEPAYELAAAAVDSLDSRRTVALLMTSVVDIAAAESVRSALGLLRQRHRPILVNLEDPDLHRLGLAESRTTIEAFAKTGALGILAGNRRMAAKLRHAGVSVASVSAKDLAAQTLQLYLRRAV